MKKEKLEKDNLDAYLEDLAEWNEHQYSPGHWTGGKLPPQLKYGGSLVGITPIVLGSLSLFGIVTEIYFTKRFEINIIFMGGFGLVMITAGIKSLKKCSAK